MQTETMTKVKATDLLNFVEVKPKSKRAKLPPDRVIKKRNKKPIFLFTEKPVKKLVLKFLGAKYRFQVKDSYKVNESNFFELMLNYIDAVKLEDKKIHFCKTTRGTPVIVASLDFMGLKEKFRNQVTKALNNQYANTEGVIIDQKTVLKIMTICQMCYVRATNPDKVKMFLKGQQQSMGQSQHFLNQ